jgi:hypothetical protein
MSKATVTRLFIGSLIAIAAGAVLAIAGVWLAIANDVFVMSGSDIVGIQGGAVAWSTLGLGAIGAIAIVGAMIAGLIAWIGALLNTWRLESKTWFAVLLLTGIFNFGFIAMIGYLLVGPDSATASAPGRAPAPNAA